jgi:hypothetical protein
MVNSQYKNMSFVTCFCFWLPKLLLLGKLNKTQPVYKTVAGRLANRPAGQPTLCDFQGPAGIRSGWGSAKKVDPYFPTDVEENYWVVYIGSDHDTVTKVSEDLSAVCESDLTQSQLADVVGAEGWQTPWPVGSTHVNNLRGQYDATWNLESRPCTWPASRNPTWCGIAIGGWCMWVPSCPAVCQ